MLCQDNLVKIVRKELALHEPYQVSRSIIISFLQYMGELTKINLRVLRGKSVKRQCVI